MTTNALLEPATAAALSHLHAEAAKNDGALSAGEGSAERLGELIALERTDYRTVWQALSGAYLSITPDLGRTLYLLARNARAQRVVEFGASMGISAIYLAAAIKDSGGGKLITTEIEAEKASRAAANIRDAGLADYVDLRLGDALATLKNVEGPIDMVLLDGSPSLYLPILKLLQPALRAGALIIGENAWDDTYLEFVREPSNGFVSQTLPLGDRGNELTLYTP